MNVNICQIRWKLTFGVLHRQNLEVPIWLVPLSFFTHGRELTLEVFYLSVLRDIQVLITKQSSQNTHTSACWCYTQLSSFDLHYKSRTPGTGKKTDFCTAVDPLKECVMNSRPQSATDNFSLSCFGAHWTFRKDRSRVTEKQLEIYSFGNKDGFCIGSKATT